VPFGNTRLAAITDVGENGVELYWKFKFQTAVVPANAGTHNPWRRLYQKASTPLPKREDTAYGSLLSQGRRLDVTPPSRDTLRPRFANSSAPKDRGRREDRVRAAPAVSCAKAVKKTHMSIQVQRKHSGLPCAMVLQLISCSPRRDLGLFVTVVPKKRELPKNLTPAIGASGPHDFAVRFSRARQSQLSRPSHPDPRFVTNAHTPLRWDGMAIEVKLICLRDQAPPLRHIGTTGKSPKCCQDLFSGAMQAASSREAVKQSTPSS
jgi:hypothetical protein